MLSPGPGSSREVYTTGKMGKSWIKEWTTINNKEKAIQFGAGNIGRGFLGQLFSQSGFQTVFVEVRDDLISLINEKKQYKLKILSAQPYKIIINNIRAVNAKNQDEVNKEIKSADIMATAVKSENLASVALLVCSGMVERAKNNITKPLNLLLCENLPEASKVFISYLSKNCPSTYIEYINSHLGLIETIISRMVPPVSSSISSKDPLFIMAEEYNQLFVDKNAFIGEIPDVKGLVVVDNFTAYQEQKLYTYNTGHAVCAYVGYQKGYKYIWEAIRDRKVKKIVRGAMMETGEALVKRHHFKMNEQEKFINGFLLRLDNPALGDIVARVGRDPIRKLSSQERLIGAAKFAEEYKVKPINLCIGIASALKFRVKGDRESEKLAKYLEKKGINLVLKEICHIDPEGKLAKLIKQNL